jgi:NAD(P)-dependent dehydrogenase (short-subunit alcohol dehydrogenase family)
MWWRDVEVNLRGTLLCCHAILPSMIARRRGRIVNVASAAAGMSLPMATSYACAKASVVQFTDALAASVSEYGISAFSISPGPTRTAMTAYILESPEGRKWMPEFERMVNNQWTPPEKIGGFVVTLARGDADALSGRFLHIRQDLKDLISRSEEIKKLDLFTLRVRQ